MKSDMIQDQQSHRRAASAALLGLVCQFVLGLVALVLGLYSRSDAFHVAAWHWGGGLIVWGVLLALYHQHRLERIEALETEQLTQTDAQAAALFDEHGDDWRMARRRLERLYKWGLSAVSLLLAGYLLVVGGWFLYRGYQSHLAGKLVDAVLDPHVNTAALMMVTAVMGFIAFIVARYESGMTSQKTWALLRGGAGYLMGNFLITALLLIGSLLAHMGHSAGLTYLTLVIPALMTLLGVDILIAWVLKIYRPKRPGEQDRPEFDSRLLSWLTNPESIAEAIREAVNYQFGFEISRSWFYQLATQAVAPLAAFGLVTMLLMSGLVVVGPDQQAIITRNGKIVPADAATQNHVFGPGLHLKWPWPIGRVQKRPVGRVYQMVVGSSSDPIDPAKAMLWTNKHAADEQYLITAPTPREDHTHDDDEQAGPGATGLSLVGSQVVVQYRVSDLEQYLRCAQDGDAIIQAVAQRRVNAYFVSQEIDTLLGYGRIHAGEQLRQQIQHDAQAMQLGVKIVFVGLVGIHPPAEQGVAEAFLDQIGAQQERLSVIEQATQEAVEIYAAVAGSQQQAVDMDHAILQLQQLQDLEHAGDRAAQIRPLEAYIEDLLAHSRGQAAQVIEQARADRWTRVIAEQSKAARFTAEVMAYRAAPRYYPQRRYLDALAHGLSSGRKYVVTTPGSVDPRAGATPSPPPVFRIDLKDVGSAMEAIFETEP